ncbi:MAG: hypothetical protein HGA96_17610, partial [Desulfobulbaceae bacterium]|nr:hypothetical protein [Desulfobulbaceae bacterium]
VETYSASVGAFCEFAEERGVGDPLAARGSLLLDWLGSVKQGISRSRLRQHQFAIKSFFAFLDKLITAEGGAEVKFTLISLPLYAVGELARIIDDQRSSGRNE